MCKILRLQPIYSVAQQAVNGYEVLSMLSPEQDREKYFSSLSVASHQSLLAQQIKIITQRGRNFLYYLNLPVALLIDTPTLTLLLPELKNNIVIELQDPQSISSLSPSASLCLVSNLSLIRANKIPIWLDDISPSFFNDIALYPFKFDGIKVDKYAFWKLSETPEHLLQFIRDCHKLTKNVSVEGIESIYHQRTAIHCGANYLQGFLWPEIALLDSCVNNREV